MDSGKEKSELKNVASSSSSAESCASEVSPISQSNEIPNMASRKGKKTSKRRHSLFGFFSLTRRNSEALQQRRFTAPAVCQEPGSSSRLPSVEQEAVEQKIETPIGSQKQNYLELDTLPITFKDISKALCVNRGDIQETECKVGLQPICGYFFQ